MTRYTTMRGRIKHHCTNNKKKIPNMHIKKVTSQTIQGKLKKNCIFFLKTKGMCAYKQGQRKPKWKVPRGSKAKTHAQGKGGGEEARKELKRCSIMFLIVDNSSSTN
jgi:hypothetical protein